MKALAYYEATEGNMGLCKKLHFTAEK